MISASQGRKKLLVPMHEIQWIETDDHYLKLFTSQGVLLKRDTLNNLSESLGNDFVRIHRRYLVNVKEIQGLEKESRALFIKLNNGERFKSRAIISKTNRRPSSFSLLNCGCYSRQIRYH